MLERIYTTELAEALVQDSQKKKGLVRKYQAREVELLKHCEALQCELPLVPADKILSFAFELSRVRAELQKVRGQLIKLTREIDELSKRRVAVQNISIHLRSTHGKE